MALTARRIARFGLTTPDAERLAAFYRAALGGRCVSSERLEGGAFRRLMGVSGGARRLCLELGTALVELLQFDQPGAAYPPDDSPVQVSFQHFALVVRDIRGALDRLSRASNWSAMSTHGPQHLPRRSGGVTAFKFRDPDGHPLEFLEFPAERMPAHWADCAHQGVLGIDHSAVSVADTARSVAFFRALGFEVASQTLNEGPGQARLDGLADARVEVTALVPVCETPHLELLCYRTRAPRPPLDLRSNDAAATRLLLEVGAASSAPKGDALVLDPDGHRLQWIGNSSRGLP